MSAEFYPNPIELAKIQEGRVNAWALDEKTEVAVVWSGGALRVFRDFCPHMGAKFSDGTICTEDGRASVQCPWHGYFFDTVGGEFFKNPNDAIFGKMKGMYKCYDPSKAPKYRLSFFAFEIRDGKAYVQKRTAASVATL